MASRRQPSTSSRSASCELLSAPASRSRRGKSSVQPLLLAASVLGFSSIIAQLLLLRELVGTFYGNELVYGLALMAWLAWAAAGASGLARLAVGGQRGRRRLALGLLLSGLLVPLQIALIRWAHAILGVVPGAFAQFGSVLLYVILVLAPLCLLNGYLFSLIVQLLVEQGGSGGQAYAWESLGAVAGGALFSFGLIYLLDPLQIALLAAALNLMVVGMLWLTARHGRLVWLLAGALLLPAALWAGHILHQATLRQQWPGLVLANDSPYGRLIVSARGEQLAFYENGLLSFETESTFAEQVVHLPLLAHPAPRQVLLIGGGIAGDVRELLRHPVQRVTYVELDPELIASARRVLPAEQAAVLDDPRLSLIAADGRQFVRTADASFDVILLDIPPPSSGALNRFYTHQFFAEARARLASGGILALGLPSAENYWSPELARRNASIYQTLRAVFPHILALPGEHVFLLASLRPLEADPARFKARLMERQLEPRLVTPAYIEYLFGSDRFAQVDRQLQTRVDVRLNSDLAPVCYYYELVLWLERFYPWLRSAFQFLAGLSWWWTAVPVVLIGLAARWRRSWALPVAVAGIGLIHMTLAVVILFAYQMLHGTVYAGVSLVITASMAGLAGGSALGNRWLARFPDARQPQATRQRARRLLAALSAGVTACAGLLWLIVQLPTPPPAAVFPLLTLVVGGLAGMAFPLAVACLPESSGRAAGRLYAADLVGGCLGAGLSSILWLPLLGILNTCALVALVGIVCLLVLIGHG